jgi:hypothetical protein
MPASKAYFLLFPLLAFLGCASGSPRRLSLLAPGVRGGHEAPRSIGRGWLALCQTGENQWTLLPASVTSRRVHDEQVDQPGEQTGREFRSSHPSALCLLRCGGVEAGRVAAADFPTAHPSKLNLLNRLGLGVQVLFSIDSYHLLAADSESAPDKYALSVSLNSGRSQTLGEFERGIEPAFESAVLIWAGDLNRDGISDFIFEHRSFQKKGQTLYLSRPGGEGYHKAGADFWAGT